MQFRLSEKAASNAFTQLVEKAQNFPRAKEFYEYCDGIEKQYMDENYPNHYKRKSTGEFFKSGTTLPARAVATDFTHCKKRNGQYKYRVFLPNAYSSAKSVIGNALDKSIPLKRADGSFKGKTELQKDIKSIKKVAPVEEQAIDAWNKFINIFVDLPKGSSTRAVLVGCMKDALDKQR